MKRPRINRNHSISRIASILGAEGFSEHAANEIRRYWHARHITEGQQKRVKQIQKAFSEMVKQKLDERDKLVLGKFISMMSRLQFDMGLRLGFLASAVDNLDRAFLDDELDDEKD